MYFLVILVVFPGIGCTTNQNPSLREEHFNTDLKLPMLDPVSVGHEQELNLESGRTLMIKTVAMRPPLFEIEHFLTDNECEHIKNIAKRRRWKQSHTLPEDGFGSRVSEGDHQLNFQDTDTNTDGCVDFIELWYARPPIQNALITIDDIEEFIQLNEYDTDGDKKLTAGEFGKIDVKLMYKWMYDNMKADKRKKTRISDQVWVDHNSDELFDELKKRLVSLTGLSKKIVDLGEKMQIVHYDVGGHYHAHYDSEMIDNKQCINTRLLDGVEESVKLDFNKYRMCRYVTVMYYLNDVEEGGETAFPVADNVTFHRKYMAGNTITDLSNHCEDANVVVKPKKGKAVMWYNHVLNEDIGWIGDIDVYSLHGGCDIKRGDKWIANHWLPVDTDEERQIQYMKMKQQKKIFNDLTNKENNILRLHHQNTIRHHQETRRHSSQNMPKLTQEIVENFQDEQSRHKNILEGLGLNKERFEDQQKQKINQINSKDEL
ncbi:transmembrane prolyl 4-hydroxylase-like [Antedon mediterranea]|uniref:transmembrane prolyl 4-hydroxylase-like n=1 Tax=Antedon mediterranea TaxID=105859 RepID=UPI003AF8098D